jgi:aminopeptidase YwaD
MKRSATSLVLLFCACGGDGPAGPPAPTNPDDLLKTLEELAAFGPKHVGSDAGAQAGQYVQGRFAALGLADVHFEEFQFPREDVASATMSLSVAGQTMAPPGLDVFDGSGTGHAEGEVVFIGYGTSDELAGRDLTGKIALVDRSATYHRAVQFANIAAKGGLAMLYVSATVDNLRQVGSVRMSGGVSLGPIPAVSIGKDDGDHLKAALAAGQTVRAMIDVAATVAPGSGRNVVGRIEGSEGDQGQIVIGAHYDSWFAGSVDNGGGVAAVLALAARRTGAQKPHYTLVFVAYDGEEVGLYGGYDYLRRHHIVSPEPILAVLNFEMPSSADAATLGLARSNVPPVDQALRGAGLDRIYPFYVGMELVPRLFGGVIPTDIQGDYRNGVPTATTATDSAFYHTVEDTPDKVDTRLLAQAVDEFDAAVGTLDGRAPAEFQANDTALWHAEVTTRSRQAGQPLAVDATITDGQGAPQANVPVTAELLVDDFFQHALLTATSDAGGHAHFDVPPSAVEAGSGHRFLHVTAGPSWPLVEAIRAIDP